MIACSACVKNKKRKTVLTRRPSLLNRVYLFLFFDLFIYSPGIHIGLDDHFAVSVFKSSIVRSSFIGRKLYQVCDPESLVIFFQAVLQQHWQLRRKNVLGKA